MEKEEEIRTGEEGKKGRVPGEKKNTVGEKTPLEDKTSEEEELE